MLTVSVVNQKGGVGKTTTAVTLGSALAYQKKRVLLIDTDMQGQVASSLGLEHEPDIYAWLWEKKPLAEVIHPTGRKNLYIIPGDESTMAAQILLRNRVLRAFKRKLPELEEAGFDVVIFDTAPSGGGFQESAILATDLVIIPTATDYLATEGIVNVLDTMAELREEYNWRGRVLGILPTFYDSVTTETKTTIADLRETFGERMILNPIHRATILRDCAREGMTLWEKAPRARAALEYARLVWRVQHDQAEY